jgi:peptidylprolyl isomerase
MTRRITLIAAAITVLAAGTALASGSSEYADLEEGLYAEFQTEKGRFLTELTYQKTPLTVKNFVGLAEGKLESTRGKGTPYFDGLTFHRVVEDFVVQSGDPKGDGTGGPGYTFPDEIVSSLKHDEAGVLSMANRGPNTNGSQFFITLKPTPWLDGKHTVFGEVVKGMEVVRKIEQGDTIEQVNIHRVGEQAEQFEADQAAFDQALEKARKASEEQARKAKATQLAYIKENWPNAQETDEGIRYVVRKEGDGPRPEKGDTVAVHYSGYLTNGTPFETTENQEKPVQFQVGVGQVIPGWDAVLMQMREGGKRTAIIPPDMAYGSQGVPNRIPPHSFLIFEVHLVEVNPEGSSSG